MTMLDARSEMAPGLAPGMPVDIYEGLTPKACEALQGLLALPEGPEFEEANITTAIRILSDETLKADDYGEVWWAVINNHEAQSKRNVVCHRREVIEGVEARRSETSSTRGFWASIMLPQPEPITES